MLQWTVAGDGPRLALLVHHTDGEREFAYDRDSSIGRLDAALDPARERGWLVVDMGRDWATVFPPPADVDQSFSDIPEDMDHGVLAELWGTNGRWGWQLELVHLVLDSEFFSPLVTVDGKLTHGFGVADSSNLSYQGVVRYTYDVNDALAWTLGDRFLAMDDDSGSYEHDLRYQAMLAGLIFRF